MIQRRTLLRGLGALLCAPAIVRASSLMPISVIEDDVIFNIVHRPWLVYPYRVFENPAFAARMNAVWAFGETFGGGEAEAA